MLSTRIAVALLLSTQSVYCDVYKGVCEVNFPQENPWETICRNRSGNVQLYPIAFQRPGLEGTDEHDLFRTGGTAYSCLRFVMHCGTVQLELRCQNMSAMYSISPPDIRAGESNIILTGTHNFSEPMHCNNGVGIRYTNHFQFEGHVSRFVLIRYCINVLRKQEHFIGFWLFVAHKNTQRENEVVMQYVARKYPKFKMANTNGTGVQLWWNPNKRCNCELYDNYIQRAARCTPPMYDNSELHERMLMKDTILEGDSKRTHPNTVDRWFVTVPAQILSILLGALLSYLFARCNDSWIHF